MNNRQVTYEKHWDAYMHRKNALKNDLKVESVEYFKDQINGRLIVLVESEKGFTREMNLKIKDTTLVIEAMRDLDYYFRPSHTHLVEREYLEELEHGGMEFGSSEIALMKSYKFEIESYQVISPDLLKVILRFEKANKEIIYN